MGSSRKNMPVKTRRRRRTDDLVSVVGAGSDGSKQKTRIKRGNTTKLANMLRDQIHFVPFLHPSNSPKIKSTDESLAPDATVKVEQAEQQKTRVNYKIPYPRGRHANHQTPFVEALNEVTQVIKEKKQNHIIERLHPVYGQD